MKEYTITQATLNDIEFVADVIISSEQGNSNKIGLCTLFNLSKEDVRQYIVNILNEEIDGCEWSVSSFLVVKFKGKCIAGLGGWIEGGIEEVSSHTLKANLIGFLFPSESLEYARKNTDVVRPFRYEREMGTLQLECAHCDVKHRGKKLVQALVEKHIENAKKIFPSVMKSQMQPFTNNLPAMKLYERCGYKGVQFFKSTHLKVLDFFAHDEKLLMERKI